MHRREAEEIRFDRECIGIGQKRVRGEWHRRIQPRAIVANPTAQRGEELRIRVITDAGLLVGRDIGRIERAEGQTERKATGIRLSIQSALRRSEEHTSELQSPIDISYAVFCWKKKKKFKGTMISLSINSSTKMK